jgi:AraC-like DNA-binding protein
MPKRVWEPSESTVEQAPNSLEVAHDQPGLMSQPHWHAQVEVNFVMRGAVGYRMFEHQVMLEAGSLALFWGGLPHQVVETSADSEFVAIHLPLVHFFRLRLPALIRHRLMHGATLVTSASDSGDFCSFDRWCGYMRSGVTAKVAHAVDELLLRIERIPFEPFDLLDSSGLTHPAAPRHDNQPFARVRTIADFIADNFRQDIDSLDIAVSAGIHPKYAMSLFRKSTGMTLNEYTTLLRLSFAQAMLINGDGNVLNVAMESGFRSLSAFNKSFRKIAGKSPSDFRRIYRSQHELRH